jgi:hypothetical protein
MSAQRAHPFAFAGPRGPQMRRREQKSRDRQATRSLEQGSVSQNPYLRLEQTHQPETLAPAHGGPN